MQKIPSLFKRNYDGDRLIYNEVVEGCEWVLAGEGFAYEKFDGTACFLTELWGEFVLYKRYDRKVIKSAKKRGTPFAIADFKAAPDNWEAAEIEPNFHTGHWPGWLKIGDGPEDKWHREGWANLSHNFEATFELVGPKIQSNPYGLTSHQLWYHHGDMYSDEGKLPPVEFNLLKKFFARTVIEGLVWYSNSGQMAKIKRRDFGLAWPLKVTEKA